MLTVISIPVPYVHTAEGGGALVPLLPLCRLVLPSVAFRVFSLPRPPSLPRPALSLPRPGMADGVEWEE